MHPAYEIIVSTHCAKRYRDRFPGAEPLQERLSRLRPANRKTMRPLIRTMSRKHYREYRNGTSSFWRDGDLLIVMKVNPRNPWKLIAKTCWPLRPII